jgi:mycoredoxin
MNGEEVVMYTADWCVYCRSLKQKLDSFSINYTEKDVDEPGVREEMNSITDNNQTIPVLFIGDNYWVNPSIAVLKEQLKITN